MNTVTKSLFIFITFFMLILIFSTFAMATEEPKYTVLDSPDNRSDIELREYSGFIIAQTTVSGKREDASSEGFKRIADYIFGNNRIQTDTDNQSKKTEKNRSAKIAMTAPVTMQANTDLNIEKIAMTVPVTIQQSDIKTNDIKTSGLQKIANPQDNLQNKPSWTVYFVMPSEYSMASLPIPNNPQVILKKIPSHKVAVIRFSGKADEDSIRQKTVELLTWLNKHKLTPAGEPSLARYNPPWIPPPMRRNEIMVKYE